MSNKIFTLDIRDDRVSAILIETGLKGNTIESAAHVRISEAPPETEDKLYWAIGQITGKMDVSGAACFLSIPPTAVTYRNLQVPFKDRKKILQVLPFELEPSLPYDISALTIDFQVVNKSEQTDVIVAAVETEILSGITGILDRYEIHPRYITAGGIPETVCLADLSVSPPGNFLFIDNQGPSATVCAVCSGKIHLIRTFKIVGADSGQLAKRLTSGIFKVMAAFETLYDFDFHPDQVLITGHGADDPDFVSALSSSLELDVRRVNLLEDTNLKLSAEGIDCDPMLFNGALGLAGIETGRIAPFNFSREHYIVQKYWTENKNDIITTGMLAAFVFVLLMFSVVVQAHFLQNQIKQLNRTIAGIYQSTFPGDEKIVDPVQQMRVQLKQLKERSAFSAEAGGFLNVDILKDFSTLIPTQTDVMITRFVTGDDNVLMSGTTDTFNSVDDIKMRLEKSKFFSRITISSANMDKTINRVRFQLKADFAKSPDVTPPGPASEKIQLSRRPVS